MTILLSPEAEEDFAALIGYLAERNPTAASELGRKISRSKLLAHRLPGYVVIGISERFVSAPLDLGGHTASFSPSRPGRAP